MKAEILPTGQFKDYWESLGSNPKVAELVQSFQLPFKSMEDAVDGVTR
jgi:coatomer protein complex subunit gamma